MPHTTKQKQKNIIRGSCTRFACRCCLTKYGWAHQDWCETPELTEPECGDCRYNSARGGCLHPARKKR